MSTPVSAPTPGEAYVLQNPEGHGAGLGHIPTGSLVQVVEVHAAGTPGVGHAGEDSVLLAHDFETHHVGGDGTPVPGVSRRHFSLHLSDFARLFKRIEG